MLERNENRERHFATRIVTGAAAMGNRKRQYWGLEPAFIFFQLSVGGAVR